MIANFVFRLLLTLNATSLLIIVFCAHKSYTLACLFPNISCFQKIPNILCYFIYFLIPVLSTGVSILLSSWLGRDDFKKGDVKSMEHANNSFLPSYLGYFFVAVGIENWETLWFVYGVLFLFTFLSQALYFNPLFLIFDFEFYNITTKNGTSIFLISRHKYKNPDQIEIQTAYRINNYTFIERG